MSHFKEKNGVTLPRTVESGSQVRVRARYVVPHGEPNDVAITAVGSQVTPSLVEVPPERQLAYFSVCFEGPGDAQVTFDLDGSRRTKWVKVTDGAAG